MQRAFSSRITKYLLSTTLITQSPSVHGMLVRLPSRDYPSTSRIRPALLFRRISRLHNSDACSALVRHSGLRISLADQFVEYENLYAESEQR